MKATIERATLLKSLGHVQSVVERRNTIPILSNVLLEAREDGSLRLMATDLDLQVDESVPANVTQPGATTVSAHTLFDIVRKLPEGSQVELTAAEGKMQIVAGRARFNLSTLPRDDFPVIAEGELPTRFELPAATLRQVIEKTRFAISGEETRYYLMGSSSTSSRISCVPRRPTVTALPASRSPRPTAPTACRTSSCPGSASPSSTACSRRSRARSKSRCHRPRFASVSAAQC